MLRILCVGDSIAYGKWDVEAGGWVARLRRYVDERYNTGEIQNAQVYNLGIPGETTRRLLQRLDDELSMRVKGLSGGERNVIVFQVGVNDVNHANFFHNGQIPKSEFIHNIDGLVECARSYAQDVVFLGLMPIFEGSLWKHFKSNEGKFFAHEVLSYAELLKSHCNEKSYAYLDLYTLLQEQNFIDGIHPGSDGHERIFKVVLSYLQKSGLVDL